jgi:hypothetical protein
MFADSDELFSFAHLELSDDAILRVRAAQECSYCHTPPAPRGMHSPDKVAEWLELYARRLGNWSDGPLVTGGGTQPRPIDAPDDERDCLVCDSQLSDVLAIPIHILAPIAQTLGFSERQRAFLQSELVLPICGVCRCSPHALAENAPKIISRYVDFRFGGNRQAFDVSDYAATAREIAGLISAEFERQRRDRMSGGGS